VRLREREARGAARILGVSELDFWRQPDGALRSSESLARRLAGVIDDLEASVLYVTHPDEEHADHRAAARIARAAAAWCRVKNPRILGYEVWTPLQTIDEVIDISAHIGTKRDAIRAHRSQCAVLRFDLAGVGLARYRGEMHSWPGGPYAEVFRALPTSLRSRVG
jgi:LmbE family N-acetylglucosaminyl deacetylase